MDLSIRFLALSARSFLISSVVCLSIANANAQQPASPTEPSEIGRCAYKNTPASQHPVDGYGTVQTTADEIGMLSQYYLMPQNGEDPDELCQDLLKSLNKLEPALHQTHPLCAEAASKVSTEVQAKLNRIICKSPKGTCGHPALIDLNPDTPTPELLIYVPQDYCIVHMNNFTVSHLGGNNFICKIGEVTVTSAAAGIGQCGSVGDN